MLFGRLWQALVELQVLVVQRLDLLPINFLVLLNVRLVLLVEPHAISALDLVQIEPLEACQELFRVGLDICHLFSER